MMVPSDDSDRVMIKRTETSSRLPIEDKKIKEAIEILISLKFRKP